MFQLIGTRGDDLTGTHITSNKPVSVLAGAQCANIPSLDYSACNYVAEEMPPTNEWGKDFLTEPLATRTKGDTWRVLAGTAGTVVTIDGQTVATLAAPGDFDQTQLTAASVIETSQPALVAQYSDSSSFDGTNSDPSETLDPPYQQYLNSYTVATAPDTRFSNWFNVVAPTSEVGSVKMNGKDLPTKDFKVIKGSDFSGAQVPVAAGTYSFSASESFEVWSYGWGVTDANSEPGGYGAGSVAEATYITISPLVQYSSLGRRLCATAVVEDEHHKPLGGIGVSFTATGPDPASGFATTTAKGTAVFCVFGSKVGSDKILAVAASLKATASIVFTNGYRLVGADGGVFDFQQPYYGSIPFPSPPGLGLHIYDFVGMAATGDGYWLVERNGGVWSFGGAHFYGSLGGKGIDDIVGMAATADGDGYWLVGANGGVYAFGDARYYGACPAGGSGCQGVSDVVAVVSPDTGGYWLVSSAGSVYSFGDARYNGSCPASGSGCQGVSDIVGMAAPDTGGYWLVSGSGSVYSFGDAPYHGSCPASGSGCQGVSQIVGIASPDPGGYWLAEAGGGIFSFGDAKFFGNVVGLKLTRAIVGIT